MSGWLWLSMRLAVSLVQRWQSCARRSRRSSISAWACPRANMSAYSSCSSCQDEVHRLRHRHGLRPKPSRRAALSVQVDPAGSSCFNGRMDESSARQKFEEARAATLATADAEGLPHLVPIVFAIDQDMIAFAVDHKPKRTTNLRRLRNIAANKHVCLLIDRYDDDWSQLWWARAEGTATVVDDPQSRALWLARLTERYEQYKSRPPAGPV